MFRPSPYTSQSLADRLRESWRERAVGVVLALGIEALLVLAMLSLTLIDQTKKPPPAALVSVSISAPKAAKDPAKAPASKSTEQASRAPRQAEQTPPVPAPVQPPAQPAQPLQIIPLDRNQMAAVDISRLPRQAPAAAAPKGLMGPPDLGVPGDSKRVGTAPGGQPMYAASWYREPYDSELRGYLSTAQGPGWALIACRTAPDFRVESCVGLDEYPDGSQIERAVLAAAWQFKVRPPRIGGVSQVGAWVRIRIDYTERQR